MKLLQKFLSRVNLLLGVVLALTPFVLFPVCQALKSDGSHMSCYYSGIFITVTGILIALLSLMPCRFVTGVLSICAAVSCWLVPNGVIHIAGNEWACGLCADPGHACRAVTMPAVGVLAASIVIVSFALMIIKFVKGGN